MKPKDGESEISDELILQKAGAYAAVTSSSTQEGATINPTVKVSGQKKIRAQRPRGAWFGEMRDAVGTKGTFLSRAEY